MDFSDLSKIISSVFGENLSELIENLDENTLSPIAILIGVDAKTLYVIIQLVYKFVSGKLRIADVLPSVFPVVIGLLTENATKPMQNKTAEESPSAAEINDNSQNFENLRQVAGENFSSFDFYLQSDSASE